MRPLNALEHRARASAMALQHLRDEEDRLKRLRAADPRDQDTESKLQTILSTLTERLEEIQKIKTELAADASEEALRILKDLSDSLEDPLLQ